MMRWEEWKDVVGERMGDESCHTYRGFGDVKGSAAPGHDLAEFDRD